MIIRTLLLATACVMLGSGCGQGLDGEFSPPEVRAVAETNQRGPDVRVPIDVVKVDLDDDACSPQCQGMNCGDDGCGGSCGLCGCGEACADGACVFFACEDKLCGDDGCGGECGQCEPGLSCSNGTCVPAGCQAEPLQVTGHFVNSVSAIAFDTVSAKVDHKRDVDEWEDGCITGITLKFMKGPGCTLTVHAGEYFTLGGLFAVQELSFEANSQCPGFPDIVEGKYDNIQGLTNPGLELGVSTVPGTDVAQSCFNTTVQLHLEGVLTETLGDKQIQVLPTLLQVKGDFLSDGDYAASCPCQPVCFLKECGDAGCGLSCGKCGCGESCDDGQCLFTACTGKECGDDGCGGSCGECSAFPGSYCAADQQCQCVVNCVGKECGKDGCGASCGACGCGETCGGGVCIFHACDDKECGDDGCGASCGECGCGETCDVGVCVNHNCDGMECGDDGCGGECLPGCGGQESCFDGKCICTPACDLKQCGDDGCGNPCGMCPDDKTCIDGQCEVTCGDGKCAAGEETKCSCPEDCGVCEGCCMWPGQCEAGTSDIACGKKGEYCLACTIGKSCHDQQCIFYCGDGICGGEETKCDCAEDCGDSCAQKVCGDDGCGGICGDCNVGTVCVNGACSDLGLLWVPIPGGIYEMGCSPGDDGCLESENPPHPVSVAPFYMLQTEVTKSQYEALIDGTPTCFGGIQPGLDTPVVCVTWEEADEFCQSIAGRLPTEAEWEYGARGGTTSKYYCGNTSSCLNDIAWIGPNSEGIAHEVKGKQPNAYGLYDILGNVEEWVEDCWHDGYSGAPPVAYPAWSANCASPPGPNPLRVARGGSFNMVPVSGGFRVSSRWSYWTGHSMNTRGFRCVRSN